MARFVNQPPLPQRGCHCLGHHIVIKDCSVARKHRKPQSHISWEPPSPPTTPLLTSTAPLRTELGGSLGTTHTKGTTTNRRKDRLPEQTDICVRVHYTQASKAKKKKKGAGGGRLLFYLGRQTVAWIGIPFSSSEHLKTEASQLRIFGKGPKCCFSTKIPPAGLFFHDEAGLRLIDSELNSPLKKRA